MFLHCFKYAMKSMLRNKHALIWTVIFPIALGTFMYMAFGSLYEKDMVFHTIDVNVVEVSENKEFDEVLDNLSEAEAGETPLLKVTRVSEKEALKNLEDGKTSAIIYEDKEPSLTVNKSDLPQEIVRNVVEQYNKTMDVIEDIAKTDPTKLQAAIDNLTNTSKEYITQLKTSDGNQDIYTNYFYAVIAMSCLFGAYAACEFAGKLSTGRTELAKRRGVAYVSKGTQAIAMFLAMWICQFIIEMLSLGYFALLGVNFGDKFPLLIPVVLAGSAVGISIGIIIGAISKLSEDAKMGVCTLISMSLSVLADLCVSGIRNTIEHTVPIVNRINPAALMTDSFYALNVFDTYDRYIRNIATLGGIAVVLLVISYMLLRRNRSASL